jgi:hypothetical protein
LIRSKSNKVVLENSIPFTPAMFLHRWRFLYVRHFCLTVTAKFPTALGILAVEFRFSMIGAPVLSCHNSMPALPAAAFRFSHFPVAQFAKNLENRLFPLQSQLQAGQILWQRMVRR